jgi:hypothetical protein
MLEYPINLRFTAPPMLSIFRYCSIFFLFSILVTLSSSSFAQVTITGGTGGENLCVGSDYTGLTSIIITETNSGDIDHAGTQTLILEP